MGHPERVVQLYSTRLQHHMRHCLSFTSVYKKVIVRGVSEKKSGYYHQSGAAKRLEGLVCN